MSIFRGPNIIRTDLRLYLDSANTKSYVGSGVDWKDLSDLNIDAQLFNSPTYDSSNKGSIVFDGVNDYSSISYINSPFRQQTQITYNFWTYKTSTGQKNIMGTSVAGGGGTGAVYFLSDTSIGFYWCPTNPETDRQITATITNSLNVWSHFAFTINYTTGTYQWYQNGSPITTSLSGVVVDYTPSSRWNQSINDYIGGWYVNNSTYYSGKISSVCIYNRVLTESEIMQNYKALKSRYH